LKILLEVEVSPSSSSPASTEILEFQLDYKQRPSQRPSQDDDDDRKLEAIISAANIPKDTLLKLKSIKMNMISSLSQMKEEDWQKLSSRSGIKPGHVVRLRRYLDERVNSKEDDHPPPLKNINSSVKQVSIKGTLSINFTDDTDKVRKQKVCDEVLIARAIQDASLLEPEIDGCLERGDKKNAKKVQEQSLRSLKAAYDRVSDKEMGGAKILATCIKRGEELMENLKTDLVNLCICVVFFFIQITTTTMMMMMMMMMMITMMMIMIRMTDDDRFVDATVGVSCQFQLVFGTTSVSRSLSGIFFTITFPYLSAYDLRPIQ